VRPHGRVEFVRGRRGASRRGREGRGGKERERSMECVYAGQESGKTEQRGGRDGGTEGEEGRERKGGSASVQTLACRCGRTCVRADASVLPQVTS
jgi:hypothetical protein